MPEFGECIWYLRPESKGVDKLDSRWEDGIYVGLRVESGEIFVMNENGVIKVKHFKQRPEEERWNQEEFLRGTGVPWEPVPGRGQIQIKSQFRIAGAGGGDLIKEPELRAEKVRRSRIDNRSDKVIERECQGAASRCAAAL